MMAKADHHLVRRVALAQAESSATGATYRTALSVLMLESYYRYLPANRE